MPCFPGSEVVTTLSNTIGSTVKEILFILALALTNTIWPIAKETQFTLALVRAIGVHTGSMSLTLIFFIAALIIV